MTGRRAAAAALAVLSAIMPRPAAGTVEAKIYADGRDVLLHGPAAVFEIASAPFRRANLAPTAACVASLGALAALDEPVRRSIQPRLTASDRADAGRIATAIAPVHDMLLAAGLYGAGLVADIDPLRATGLRGMEALFINEGFTGAIKELAGRRRPGEEQGAFRFRPFHGDTSLPSGHTSNAFALATVVSRMGRRTALTWTAYALASSVACARVAQDLHWTSDVAAAAILGIGVGRAVTAETAGGGAIGFYPSASPPGIAAVLRF